MNLLLFVFVFVHHFFYYYSHIVKPSFFPIKFTFFLCYPLHCINKAKFKTSKNDVNPARPTQNIPRVTKLIKRITIQKTKDISWGIQKNNEFIIDMTLLGLLEAKYQVYVSSSSNLVYHLRPTNFLPKMFLVAQKSTETNTTIIRKRLICMSVNSFNNKYLY